MKKKTREYGGTVLQNIKGLRNLRCLELVFIDIAIICITYIIFGLVSSKTISSLAVDGEFTLSKLLILIACMTVVRILASIYSSIWRYANQVSYLRLLIADIAGGIVYFLIGRIARSVRLGFAASVILVLMIFAVTLASRLIYQYIYDYTNRVSDTKGLARFFKGDLKGIHRINVAIVGAGNVGANLADELLRNPKAHYFPYCFIDKDARKIGSGINGIKIYPEDDRIVDRIKNMPVQEIVIALPDATQADRARLYSLYRQTDCKVKLYDYPLNDNPAAGAAGGGRRSLREFSIEDLLFRNAISVGSERTRFYYGKKTVMVTGGGGSIGSELCRQIASFSPKRLVILDIYENNAYDIQQELIGKYGLYDEVTGKGIKLDTIIASVRDEKRLEEIFAEVRPDIVFHAAAHKHVPLMENNGWEAVKNNVLGTYNVANMAEKYGAEKFLLISTDKAVNPTNVMGASKRLCEMIVQSRTDSTTEFAAVRFGNVLGSNGSVIPLFKKQIEGGGPITITDRRIIRYFMTIPEAVGLVLEAGAMARKGELFVLDMGKPVRILDLAENMIVLSGLKPYDDIDIVEIGLRPGEKLYEELLMKTEELDKTSNEMIFIERDRACSREEIEEKLRILKEALEKNTGLLDAIRATVPTYKSPDEVNKSAEKSREMASVKSRGGSFSSEVAAASEAADADGAAAGGTSDANDPAAGGM